MCNLNPLDQSFLQEPKKICFISTERSSNAICKELLLIKSFKMSYFEGCTLETNLDLHPENLHPSNNLLFALWNFAPFETTCICTLKICTLLISQHPTYFWVQTSKSYIVIDYLVKGANLKTCIVKGPNLKTFIGKGANLKNCMDQDAHLKGAKLAP